MCQATWTIGIVVSEDNQGPKRLIQSVHIAKLSQEITSRVAEWCSSKFRNAFIVTEDLMH